MATKQWTGAAPAVAQVQTWAFAGTWEANDLIRATIGGKTVDFTAGSTTTATVVSNLVTAWNALSQSVYPEFTGTSDGATASANSTTFTLTAKKAGVPFIVTLTPLESNGGSADSQTIEGGTSATTGTQSTASSGPNHWDATGNWSGGAIPVDTDDIVFSNSSIDCLYGISQSSIDLASLKIEQSYTGKIGLADHNGLYPEYRTKDLTLGTVTLLEIGKGIGNGSQRIRLDVGSNACTLNMLNSGSSSEAGAEPVLWKGTHASNVVNVSKGQLGIATRPGETATVATLRVGYLSNQAGDSTVRCGAGTTLTTIEQAGGRLEINSAVTTLGITGGDCVFNGSAAMTTLNADGGKVHYRSSGTLTTANVGDDAELDFSQDMRDRTVTNCTLSSDAKLADPFGTVTFTNPMTLNRCGLKDVDLDLGTHITIARAAA